MQQDMHYYGTYCMARAAGLTTAAAQIVASAAQYVDDNVSGEPIVLRDGARLLRSATAHHISDIRQNINADDQRLVWVPFHFLPGNQPDGDDDDFDYTALLKCRKDSEPARVMVSRALESAAGDPCALERIGVTAHVYADTFSHYGFSGVGSRRNKVDGASFEFDHDDDTVAEMKRKGDAFFAKFDKQGGLFRNIRPWVDLGRISRGVAALKSDFAEEASGALGHGPVATYPDQPYLSWSYETEYPQTRRVQRNNPADFLDACIALHRMFVAFAAKRPADVDQPARGFDRMRDAVMAILALAAPAEMRAQAWIDAAKTGALFGHAEDIPPYLGEDWTKWLAAPDDIDSFEAMAQPACRFHVAAGCHRSFVLHELMPVNNLLVA